MVEKKAIRVWRVHLVTSTPEKKRLEDILTVCSLKATRKENWSDWADLLRIIQEVQATKE